MATGNCLLISVLFVLAPRFEGKKVHLNASMLSMYPELGSVTIGDNSVTSDISRAVDGDPGNDSEKSWLHCAVSKLTKKEEVVLHWLAIDLKGIYLISKVMATFPQKTLLGVTVFVGNNPSANNGSDDFMCEKPQIKAANVKPAPHFYDFECQPARWASHVRLQRVVGKWQYLAVCEVEVHYAEHEESGIRISLSSAPAASQTVFVGEQLLCSSSLPITSNATVRLLRLRWTFPNGTTISERRHGDVTQQRNATSVGLFFNSVKAPHGNYSCKYRLNGQERSHSLYISAFDCGWSDWSPCSNSCGKGTRELRYKNAVSQRNESGCSRRKRQCFGTTCGKLDLSKIGAVATQGPQNRDLANSRNASLAIDGRIIVNNSNSLNDWYCAASKSSSSRRPWLQIDLQNVYLVGLSLIHI